MANKKRVCRGDFLSQNCFNLLNKMMDLKRTKLSFFLGELFHTLGEYL